MDPLNHLTLLERQCTAIRKNSIGLASIRLEDQLVELEVEQYGQVRALQPYSVLEGRELVGRSNQEHAYWFLAFQQPRHLFGPLHRLHRD
jgi:hypothetical protein